MIQDTYGTRDSTGDEISSSELRELLNGLFASQKLAVLATHQDGQPYSNLVAFAATDDLNVLLFATTRATRKYRNLAADPRVSMLMDNRSNRESDFHDAVAVTATGRAEELQDAERRGYSDLFLRKHPHMKEFVLSPTCALVRMQVDCYYVVRYFQTVVELRPTP